MRMSRTFGLSLAALAASGWIATASAQAAPGAAPAPADSSAPAPAKASAPTKKATHHGGAAHVSKDAGNAAVEDLNAQSLDAAKSGKSFTPPTTTEKPPAPSKTKAKPTHHHHIAKKAAPADATPPADSTPK